jgi:hypothetical protein
MSLGRRSPPHRFGRRLTRPDPPHSVTTTSTWTDSIRGRRRWNSVAARKPGKRTSIARYANVRLCCTLHLDATRASYTTEHTVQCPGFDSSRNRQAQIDKPPLCINWSVRKRAACFSPVIDCVRSSSACRSTCHRSHMICGRARPC